MKYHVRKTSLLMKQKIEGKETRDKYLLDYHLMDLIDQQLQEKRKRDYC